MTTNAACVNIDTYRIIFLQCIIILRYISIVIDVNSVFIQLLTMSMNVNKPNLIYFIHTFSAFREQYFTEQVVASIYKPKPCQSLY